VLAGCALVVSLLFVPYSMWQRMFVEKLARGPHAADFLTYSAATGDLGTVEAFLQRGLSIDARDRDGSTALQGAAVGGQIEVVEYLVAHGANPNLRNDFGNTALDNAREMKRPTVVWYLEHHGAK
jgi:ankyrin repeat protein